MIEVEVKARVNNFDEIKSNLEKQGAKFLKKEFQRDIIFGNPKFADSENKIIEGGVLARIRQKDKYIKIELKEILRGKGGVELKFEIKDIEAAKKFLAKMDFTPAFEIAKNRESYDLNGFRICLDKVEKLGTFVEVEKVIGKEKDKKIVMKECKETLKKITNHFEILLVKYGDLMQDLINQGKS